MPFDCSLEFAEFPIPDLDGCVFRARGQRRKDGVKCDAGYGRTMGLEGMPCGGAWQPAGRILVLSQERCRRGGIEFALEALIALLKFQNLDSISRVARFVAREQLPSSAGALRWSTSFPAGLRTSCASHRRSSQRRWPPRGRLLLCLAH